MNNLLQLLTKRTRGGEAIAAPNRDPQTYALLSEQILRAGGELRSIAIEPNSRVAMVLPNGPLMASAFVSLAPWCTTAPLNPAYKSDEFEFYLQDLEASVLMVETGSESGAIEVAHRLGIRVIEIEEGEEAGSFPSVRRGMKFLLGKRMRSRLFCTHRGRRRGQKWCRFRWVILQRQHPISRPRCSCPEPIAA